MRDQAELRLYAESVIPGRTIDLQALSGPWQEMAVNWSTQPAATGAVASTGSGDDKGWRTWLVTEQVAGM